MTSRSTQTRIGLISDTHNLVRPEALRHLAGCDAIIHAGDICDEAVLDALGQIAPVTAVRGNNDVGEWARALPTHATLTAQQVTIRIVHDIDDLDGDMRSQGVSVVVTGHSHNPLIVERDGVLFVNPGSAGPRRFRLPISAGLLVVEGASATATLHSLVT